MSTADAWLAWPRPEPGGSLLRQVSGRPEGALQGGALGYEQFEAVSL
jgi:hypothetical protein